MTGLTSMRDVLAALNDNIKDFRSHLDETLERVEDRHEHEWLASAARWSRLKRSLLSAPDWFVKLRWRRELSVPVFVYARPAN
ncbi:MAG TPA: hypothetical protein VGN90_15245 [Pyrinomonadaceae bacterium]|nr:hypothetical protein [Pyrinomonadaceae bacterium]